MAELNLSPGKSSGRHTNRLPIRVDLTALVDLAFLLITFFMLTTSLARSRSMPLAMPEKDGGMAVPQSATMTICLGKTHALWYLGMTDKPLIAPTVTAYGKDLNKTILDLSKRVKASTGRNLMVIVKPSAHSVYNSLVNTIDELNITQVNSYAIIDITPKDIDLLKEKRIY